ncbi:MAG: hypothetical protein GIX01_12625 [Candidatus Eremiobacteraeota bacterium]|nr:hypothetical protein [Candidatus Eremiobacteraeota bacterium]
MPIALPMVDRLIPETIRPDQYRGPDRGRALSAAALSAEMSGEQARADALISEAGANVRDQFDRRDVPSAFEVSQNTFFIARCRGDLHAMRAAVRSMAPLYDLLGPGPRVKFALDCSEVFLYEGRLRDARSELDFALLCASPGEGSLLTSITLLRKAQIALACRDLEVVEEAGKTAMRIARSHADIRVYAVEVLGRSALRTGSPWSSNGLEECHSPFHALSIRTLLARHRLQRGKLAAAYDMAAASYEHAMRLRYWNLASRSASTLAMCGSPEGARAWLAQALRLHLHSEEHNAYVADDLFEIGPLGRQVMRAFLHSDDAVALVGELYLKRFPDSLFEPGIGSLLSPVARFILHRSLDLENEVSSDLYTSAIRQWSRQSIGLCAIERDVRSLGKLLCSLSSLLPFEQRDDFIAANRRQLYRMVCALRRSRARYHWTALRSSS